MDSAIENNQLCTSTHDHSRLAVIDFIGKNGVFLAKEKQHFLISHLGQNFWLALQRRNNSP